MSRGTQKKDQREGSSGDEEELSRGSVYCQCLGLAQVPYLLSQTHRPARLSTEDAGHAQCLDSRCFEGQCSRCPRVSESTPSKGFPPVTESLDQVRRTVCS